MLGIDEALERFGFDRWLQPQLDCFEAWLTEGWLRMCVYYPTGSGKTETMLTCLALRGFTECIVVAPPITHERWITDGAKVDIVITPISHAKFRMKGVRFNRDVPMIVDEFHLLGGHTGVGWRKLDAMAAGMRAPLIIGSATPNYNDAERVYCIAHVLDPFGNRGGYLSWLYAHCQTEPNHHGSEPVVVGFHKYASAEEFLAKMPGVVYLPDSAPNILIDIPMGFDLPVQFHRLGLDMSRRRLMASMMEKRHRSRFLQIVDPVTGQLRQHVYDKLTDLRTNSPTPVLVYAMHSEVAKAAVISLREHGVQTAYMDGDTPLKVKFSLVQQFIDGLYDVLVGTSTMATGTDGIDKMCDEMVIIDDTDDDAHRRQLVGRILPRGASANYAGKHAHRFIYD